VSRDAARMFFGFILGIQLLFYISEIPEKEKTPPMPPGGMGGMDS